MTVRILHGDALEQLRTLADESVHSIVTDPPYGLEFMGVAWDTFSERAKGKPRTRNEWGDFGSREHARHPGEVARIQRNKGLAFQVFTEAWARECLRVLKPGGHLLSFGGSRTYHRMACAIEDAGFEIRDQIMWIYGSGFPKSLDVSKAIDKTRAEVGRELEFCAFMRATSLTQKEATRILQERGLISANGTMAGHFFAASMAGQPAIATRDIFEALRPHFGCAVPDRIEEVVARAEAERLVIGKGFSAIANSEEGPRYTIGASKGVEFDITAPATEPARQWQGWGTALKPAHEPIVVARKPLIGTVAANILKFGTGAINIDACRVEAECDTDKMDIGCSAGLRTASAASSLSTAESGNLSADPSQSGAKSITRTAIEGITESKTFAASPSASTDNSTAYTSNDQRNLSLVLDRLESAEQDASSTLHGLNGSVPAAEKNITDSKGRWPSNLIHDGSDEVLAGFPDSDGQQGSITGDEPSSKTHQVFGGFNGRTPAAVRLDTGSAGRFFYTAKAAADDRNTGSHSADERNHHPTVKPTDLMQYLVRLVTPPGGTVLDPFAGSGSTGLAADREGFDAILIEREAEYVEIARRRIVGDCPLFADFALGLPLEIAA